MNPLLIGPLADLVKSVIGRIWPDPAAQADAQLKLAVMVQNGELAQLAADTDLAKGQIDINKVEASSSSLLVSGWRPAVGWICGLSLAYAALIEPMARFIAAVMFQYAGAFPVVDTSITLQVLLGLLGLGALRTYDKKQGVASK
jgi:hypothetical protein